MMAALRKCDVGDPPPALVGTHPAIRAAVETVDRVASSGCSVLVTGENGTGKALVVRLLHDASPRRDAALVVVHCGAVPPEDLEAEIAARLEESRGGTLFLDEIGEIAPLLQVKVLRLLKAADHDARIVAATHRDLEADVEAGRFREDLYYRLNVITIALPALRDRSQDIDALADHFLEAAMTRSRRWDLLGFTDDARCALHAHDWPGNVRALENAIERGVLLARGSRIALEDLPEKVRSTQRSSGIQRVSPALLPAEGLDLRQAVDSYETELLRQALERTGNNKNAAAALLRMNRTTLVEMAKRKKL